MSKPITPEKYLCPTCGGPCSYRAKRCMACYRKDPPQFPGKPKPTCEKCGRVLGSVTAKLCLECYRSRGPDSSSKKKRYTCQTCNTPITSRSKQCVRCYRAGAIQTAAETDPTTGTYRPALELAYPEAWSKWQALIGMRGSKYRGAAEPSQATERRRVAVLSDLHVPVHDVRMFADWLQANEGADLCVCMGDLSDSFSVSSYTKEDNLGGWRAEFAELQIVMEELSSRFPQVVIVIGNHDRRLQKRVREANLTQDAVDAIVSLAGTLDPVRAIARGVQKVTIADWAVPGTVPPVVIDWFTVVGSDCWVGHGEGYSKVPGTHLRRTAEYLSQNRQTLGLERVPRLVLCGHTHSLAMIPYHADQLLVETGCLVSTQRYQVQPTAVRGGPPQRRGGGACDQTRETDGGGVERWVSDLNSVKLFWYDVDRRFYERTGDN